MTRTRFVIESPTVVAFQRHELAYSGRARFLNGVRRFARKPRKGTLAFTGRRRTADRYDEERRQKHNGDCPNNRFFAEKAHIGIIGEIAKPVENNIEISSFCPEQNSGEFSSSRRVGGVDGYTLQFKGYFNVVSRYSPRLSSLKSLLRP